MTSRTLTIACIAALSITVALFVPYSAMGQHQHGGTSSSPSAGSQADHSMMHSPEQMGAMMSGMAANPEMLKHHLATMIQNPTLRPAIVSLLKQDAGLRDSFAKLLSDAKP